MGFPVIFILVSELSPHDAFHKSPNVGFWAKTHEFKRDAVKKWRYQPTVVNWLSGFILEVKGLIPILVQHPQWKALCWPPLLFWIWYVFMFSTQNKKEVNDER